MVGVCQAEQRPAPNDKWASLSNTCPGSARAAARHGPLHLGVDVVVAHVNADGLPTNQPERQGAHVGTGEAETERVGAQQRGGGESLHGGNAVWGVVGEGE